MSLPFLIVNQRSRLPFTIQSNQFAVKGALPPNWFFQTDVRTMPGESFVIGRLVEPTIQSRRSYFEHVLVWDQVLDIEDQADSFTYGSAVISVHTAGFVDEYPQELCSTTGEFSMHELNAFTSRHPFNDLQNSRIQLDFLSLSKRRVSLTARPLI